MQRIVTNINDKRDKREADIKVLLEAALAEARVLGLEKLIVWSPQHNQSPYPKLS